ncbi:MAG: SDR family NAD(P)-dependent oxidoreductase [Bifidobacteriaceae bacterium]|jgi:NADP-dependent 3-hydroxy acid dehydrogenase YdfG|nr:SDR family NAD(P)-dependent oxidoreductase [Bifidobacteriaceae bacterium]
MRTAVVTGASSGIGAATAVALARDNWRVVLGARRTDRLAEVAKRCGPNAIVQRLDVTDQASVDALAGGLQECTLLVNNAGGAHGLRSIAEAQDGEWEWMLQTNVMGTMRVTRALLPLLLASGDGIVITIASIAAHYPYAGGSGYNAAKFAERGLVGALRADLAGLPVRVTEIDPGLVRTEFSLVRFDGDESRADATYEGITPLVADDVAECVRWVASLPSHVNIDGLSVLARDQIGPVKTTPKAPRKTTPKAPRKATPRAPRE